MSNRPRFNFVGRYLKKNGSDSHSNKDDKKSEKRQEPEKPESSVDSGVKNSKDSGNKCSKCNSDLHVDYKGDEKITTCTSCGYVKRERISDKNLKTSENIPSCIYCNSPFVIEQKDENKIRISCKDKCGFSFVLERLEPLGWIAIDSWTPRQKEKVSKIAIPSTCQKCAPGTEIEISKDGNKVNFKCVKCDFNGTLDPDNGLFTSTWSMSEEEVDTVRILIRKVPIENQPNDKTENMSADLIPDQTCDHCDQEMEIADVEELFNQDGKFNVYTLECKNSECEFIVKKGSGICQIIRASKLQTSQQPEDQQEESDAEESEEISADELVEEQETHEELVTPTECSYCPAELKLVDVKDDLVKYECVKGCGYSISIYPSQRPEHSDRRVVKEEWQAPAGSDTVFRLAQDMKHAVDAKKEHADCPHCSGKLEERALPYIHLVTGQNVNTPYLFRCNNSGCLYSIHYDQNADKIVEFWELDPDEYTKIAEQAKQEFIKQIKQQLKDRKYILNEGDRCPVEDCTGILIKLPTVAKANGKEDEEAVILSCLSCSWSWSTSEPIGDALNATPEKCPICTSYFKILNADGQKWCPACLKSKEELIEVKKKRDEEEKRRKEEEKKKREQEALEKMRAEGRARLAAQRNENSKSKPEEKPKADDKLDDEWFDEKPEDRPFDAAALQDPAAGDDPANMPDPQPIPEDEEPDPEPEIVEPSPTPDVQSASDESKAESDIKDSEPSAESSDPVLDEKLIRLEAHLLKFGPMLEEFIQNKLPELASKGELSKNKIRIDELFTALKEVKKKMITGDAAAKRIQGIENSLTSLREDMDEVNGKVKKKLEEKKFWQPPRVYKFIIPTVIGVLLFLFIFLGLPYHMVDSKIAEIETLKTSFIQKEDLAKSETKFDNAVKELKEQNSQRKVDDTKLANKIKDIDKKIIEAKAQVGKIIATVNDQADILADIQAKTDWDILQGQLNILSAQINKLKAEQAQYATKKDLTSLPANQASADRLDQMQKDIAALKAQVQGLLNIQKLQNDTIRKQQAALAARQQAAQTQPAQPKAQPQAAPRSQAAQPSAPTTQPTQRPQAAQSRPAAQPQPAVQPAPRSRRPYTRPAYRSRQTRGSGPLVISGQGKKSGRYKGIGYDYECYGVGCDSPLVIK